MNTPEYKQLLPILQEAVDNGMLTERDGKFASSLLEFHEKKGFLSPKQAAFIPDLIARATGVRSEKVAAAPRGSTGEHIDASRLQDLFRSAARNQVQWPAIMYPFEDIGTIKVFLADNQQDIVFINKESRVRYAWFTVLDSLLHCTASAPIRSETYNAIRRVLADPVGEAIFSGKKIGTCMFCMRGLENNFSVQHGYGPICAANYGLPWNAAGGSAKARLEDFIGLGE